MPSELAFLAQERNDTCAMACLRMLLAAFVGLIEAELTIQ